jgi:EmrB/QacA subfamily drug resistance transporter
MAKKEQKKPSHWLTLILLALAQFMVVLDVSIVNVALPSIRESLNISQGNLQWIITAYTLTFGGFLLLGGRAADLFGRRRMFLAGVTVFAIASLADGLAQSGGMLIFFRALQGLAGAFMSPAALSIILVTYKEGHERNVALSVWGSVAAGGAAAGVLLGGIFTQYLGWRWNFLINVPIGAGVLFAAMKYLDKHESTVEHNNLDLPGAVLVTGGLMTLVYALVKAPELGWTNGKSLLYFGVAIAALVGFVTNELRAKHPLIPFKIFRIRNLSAANVMQLFMAAGMFSIFFFTTLYLQLVLGYTPLHTGLSFLVVPLVIGLTASNVPKLVQKIGYRKILMVSPLFVSAGLFYLSHIPLHGTFWGNVAPGMAIMAFGMGGTFVALTIAATSGVPKHESGLASGLLNTAQQIGGALGLAVLSGIATSSSTHYIQNLNLHAKPTALNVAAAQVHGFHNGFLIASCFGLVASMIAIFVIRQPKGEVASFDPSAMA